MPEIKPSLNNRQLEAVKHPDGPLLIVAGAGSGKTKTLTSRLTHLIESGINPKNIIAITFTNKAANEMRNRVTNLELRTPNFEPFIGTFHSLGAHILKREAKLLKRTSAFTIFDNDDSLSLIRKIMKDSDVSKDQYSPMSIQNKISSVKNDLLDAEEYLDRIALKIFEKYETSLIKNNAFDFDDLIEKVVRLFEKNPAVLEKYQNQFKYILVDEYQDVNTAQYRFVKLLAEKHQNISVVGDDSQSIYRFRGSDFRNFLNFENDWPQAKVVKLEQNYRSTSNIITAASKLIKNNKSQKPKELWTENSAGNLIKVIAAPDAEEEANWIADAIQKLVISNQKLGIEREKIFDYPCLPAGRQLPIIAILYRTNAQSRAMEQALISADIPYRIFGGLKFYERKEIKDIVAALRLAANPKDQISAERILKNFNKPVAENLLAHLPRLGKELKILELINFFLSNANYFEYLEKNFKNYQERMENINELINFAGEFSDLPDFLERVSLLQSADQPNSLYRNIDMSKSQLNPVQLMTIHLAKGLEFDNVFVIGCNEGLLPHQMSYGSLDELEEERRLMYVAMTRAKKELCLSFYNMPSRFLNEIPPELTEFTDLAGDKKELSNEDDIYYT
ncbi:MAG: hypothetical protein A2745_00150 [Candidatus Harrisonbacteria bacterium RIFCSPHIGHO2_01_FULL_44_13]|uniref:DNA 3'-5' helicase n=1 Tax=Candidatus Harrisonbacteria bacterium RIFCSPLOWO2_01_FULL_44_18 TaxID=1798407 RepID=A0A1G1ZPE6_9BACT|nr:MAG: hypothetical protein A2745_00150 [Candidatus Harrisonbacteria bacterium RIFCSPHIGHO2_01_FULL_44_13]OGY65737.1 MAG: hypothetical protein A3A16_03945 [Candidatus Harrisonbacteria bacterium RIFCSPLOWO2_01_FULL_44_18]